jgi:hypothetical protein
MQQAPRDYARHLFRKWVPKRVHPYARTASRTLLSLPLFVRGLIDGQKLGTSDFAAGALECPVVGPSDSHNPLEGYFDSHTEGRGIWKWRHYFDIYHRHFAKFIGKDVRIVEIGVYSGGSLDMWKRYFGSKSVVYGIDIESACKTYEGESVKVFIGDQADRHFWKRFKEQVPPVDIVIDDGGHLAHQQVVTLQELFPHLRPGGIYLCEDVHDKTNPFHAYIDGLARNLHAFLRNDNASSTRPNGLQRVVHSVHIYPFVVVIEKLEHPITEFIAPKRGTQWQPFL